MYNYDSSLGMNSRQIGFKAAPRKAGTLASNAYAGINVKPGFKKVNGGYHYKQNWIQTLVSTIKRTIEEYK